MTGSWDGARTLPDVGAAVVRWLRAPADAPPIYGDGPDPETLLITDQLVTVNQLGLVTHFSQPGLTSSDGDLQRATVSGFCPERLAHQVFEACALTDLVVLRYYPGWVDDVWVPISRLRMPWGEQQMTWARGPIDPADAFEGCPEPALVELRRAWQIVVIDPVWGRNDFLWTTLIDALSGSADVTAWFDRFGTSPTD